MLKYSIGAAIVSVVLTVAALSVVGKVSAAIGIGAAAISALITVLWFAKSERREPTKAECTKIVLVYGALMAVVFGMSLLGRGSPTYPGLLSVLALYLGYPLFMSLVFKPANVARYLK